eukprot:TRINITY_DN6146_c0_g2_i2.p2 TRINITY_DN6146_c0_g2~~TRINITY_DN6146_c0_g2_i2.p2  ORF type:complete len:249 (-),score=92.16 TRINITY_DN6146_c0_g2_i2:28-774(-)
MTGPALTLQTASVLSCLPCTSCPPKDVTGELKLVLGCLSHHHAVDAENATVLSPGLAAVAGARATKSITVKVFATSATRSASAVRDACDTALKTLGVSTIDTFLLSRDPKCPVALVDLWAAVEELFIDGKVNTVGLSDARLSQLAALAEDAQYPPTVLELRRGWENERERARVIKDARMHGVRVTTHGNLAVDMIDEDRVMAMIDGSGYGDAVPRGARIEWGLRYTEVLKCRSLVKSRAYILRCAGEA